MGISLDDFIAELNDLKDNAIKYTEQEIKDLFYAILELMAKSTVIDTGQARSAIIDIFAKKYGYDVSHLKTPFYFWHTLDERDWGNADVKYKDNFKNDFAYVYMEIDDEGLFRQEIEGLPPSKMVPGRDNSNFFPRHITIISDTFYQSKEFEEFVNKIIEKLESQILK